MSGYELWDMQTRNLLDSCNTFSEAMIAANELIDADPEWFPKYLALALICGGGTYWLLSGGMLGEKAREYR